MEKLFQYLARASASFVLVILLSTVIILYINARPAIEEFGMHFIVDTRWAVDVPIEEVESSDKSSIPAVTTDSDTPQNHNISAIASDVKFSSINKQSAPLNIDDEFADMDEEVFVNEEFSTSLETNTKTVYGGAVPIIGSVFSIIIAMFFAVPVALGIAVFLSEIASERLSKPTSVAIELLAAIPSIIYGMWALFYFGPLISKYVGGHSVSLLVAGLVLGVMVIPFMAALSRDAINTTPDVLKESAYSMGATKFEVIKDIIFPYAKAGIVGSVIVSFGRGIGETMAVAFVIGGVFEFAGNITSPTNSIPVVLANNFSESSGMSMSVLYYLALILFVLSFTIIFLAKYFLLRRKAS
ncbi:MAG: phosphate ABC transporter permease subunit PstC [Gammaproteobacteria bacterium CG22_combo_CG10-13_8_21_14_all_40_8]|nr:MAG: phosphate ABC transporter permease subunit PstC [Gammaproteobacteria bacterium CG22_combo_CG10-13_8_21_14_all_40_8]